MNKTINNILFHSSNNKQTVGDISKLTIYLIDQGEDICRGFHVCPAAVDQSSEVQQSL